MSSTIRYSFEDIPNFTTFEIALKAGLLDQLPATQPPSDLFTTLGKALGELVKTPVTLKQIRKEISASEIWGDNLGRAGLAITLSLRERALPVFIHLDQGSAMEIIAQMFGSQTSETRSAGSLSEAEIAVCSYVVLKLIHTLANSGWPSIELTQLRTDVASWRSRLLETTHVYSVDIGLTIGQRGGVARLALPLSVLDFTPLTDPEWALPRDTQILTRRIDALSHLNATFKALVAELDLNEEECRSLKEGDIILLDDHELSWNHDQLQGTIRLVLQNEPRAEIKTMLTQTATGRDALEITTLPEYFAREDTDMSDEEEVRTEEHTQVANIPQTETLLREIPAAVSIELGRIELNASEVARLRQGQILKLPRNSNDPVNLVVDNEVFARGELVRVDGELGVRIASILEQTEESSS